MLTSLLLPLTPLASTVGEVQAWGSVMEQASGADRSLEALLLAQSLTCMKWFFRHWAKIHGCMWAWRQADVTKTYKNTATHKTKNTKTRSRSVREKPQRVHTRPSYSSSPTVALLRGSTPSREAQTSLSVDTSSSSSGGIPRRSQAREAERCRDGRISSIAPFFPHSWTKPQDT